jgi:soluble lytic murein transglycosylase-like protein
LEIAELDLSADSALTLYRHPATRNAVIDFFIDLVGSEEVALTVLYYSDKFKINPFMTFSLMYTESRFSPIARNQNPSSVDRGLFQLNSVTFANLQDNDFFSIDTNSRHGISHLKWCLDRAKGNEDVALAIYNAGPSRVLSGNTPPSTQAYVKKNRAYRNSLAQRFKVYISRHFDREVDSTSEG